jgi:hypothetical protein
VTEHWPQVDFIYALDQAALFFIRHFEQCKVYIRWKGKQPN